MQSMETLELDRPTHMGVYKYRFAFDMEFVWRGKDAFENGDNGEADDCHDGNDDEDNIVTIRIVNSHIVYNNNGPKTLIEYSKFNFDDNVLQTDGASDVENSANILRRRDDRQRYRRWKHIQNFAIVIR